MTKRLAPLFLFLKAQQRGARGRVDDLFGANPPLMETTIQVRGSVDKEGHVRKPHTRHVKVRAPEVPKSAAPKPDVDTLRAHREILTDMIEANPRSASRQQWENKLAEINARLGAEPKPTAPAAQAQDPVDKTGWTDARKAAFDLYAEYRERANPSSATRVPLHDEPKAVGAFKRRVRALAAKTSSEDTHAVALLDAVWTRLVGSDYDPRVKDLEFAPARKVEPVAPAEAKPEHRYAAVNRPPGYATVPEGYTRIDDRPNAGEDHHDIARHGVVVYPRPLTDDEMRSYELRPLVDGKDRDALVDQIATNLSEYRDAILELADDDIGYARQAVHDKLEESNPTPSVGHAEAFADAVIAKLRAQAGDRATQPGTKPIYENGEKISILGPDPAHPGFEQFVYLTGSKAGSTGLRRSPEERARDDAKRAEEHRQQQEAARKIMNDPRNDQSGIPLADRRKFWQGQNEIPADVRQAFDRLGMSLDEQAAANSIPEPVQRALDALLSPLKRGAEGLAIARGTQARDGGRYAGEYADQHQATWDAQRARIADKIATIPPGPNRDAAQAYIDAHMPNLELTAEERGWSRAAAPATPRPPAPKTLTLNAMQAKLAELGRGYHDKIPLNEIFSYVRATGYEPVQEDGSPWSGVLTGADGRAMIPLTRDGRPTKASLTLSWHKMPSGRYEVTPYVSGATARRPMAKSFTLFWRAVQA